MTAGDTGRPAPLILTCGEPAGIGPELAPRALAAGVPFVWMGDPRHLPAGTDFAEVADPADPVPPGTLPVLRHDFAAPATPGCWRASRSRSPPTPPCSSCRAATPAP